MDRSHHRSLDDGIDSFNHRVGSGGADPQGSRAKPNLFGQTILLATVIADFVTMFLISVLVAVISRGLTAEILLVFLLFVAFFFAARFGSFLSRIESLQRVIQELSHATAQIKVRAAFSTLLIFVVLAEKLGIEIIVGAFLAGAIVALLRTPEDRELSSQLEAIGFGFFIPIFFIMVGVDFNLPALLSSTGALLSVPLLLIAAIAVKIIPALVFRLNHTWREAFGRRYSDVPAPVVDHRRRRHRRGAGYYRRIGECGHRFGGDCYGDGIASGFPPSFPRRLAGESSARRSGDRYRPCRALTPRRRVHLARTRYFPRRINPILHISALSFTTITNTYLFPFMIGGLPLLYSSLISLVQLV